MRIVLIIAFRENAVKMNNINKGKSPFYPGQPVPVDFFIGRFEQIERIRRAVNQVELGKPQAIFLTGEYGIGKSSLANLMRFVAEKENKLFGIYVFIGDAISQEQVAIKTVEAAINSRAYEPSISEKVRNALSKYIGKPELFGFSIDFRALKADGPSISRGYLPFLHGLFKKVEDDGIKGVMLIFDEINGISKLPEFAHFLKTIVDENAISDKPLPLLIMICGVDERRQEIITSHPPVERIFDIVNISQMDDVEMKDFFEKTFGSVGVKIDNEAMSLLCEYSAGFPKIMHHIGDAVFWLDKDNYIDRKDALSGILVAADEIGRKLVDHQIYNALRSKDYHSILSKLGKSKFDLSFKKTVVEKGLTEAEKRKFNNFLQRMKKLNAIRSGGERGEYIFNNRLVRLYILLKSLEKNKKS
jgi:hypothetical protein